MKKKRWKESSSSELRIVRIDQQAVLVAKNLTMNLSDYQIKSSIDGTIELTLKMKGIATQFDLSTSLIEKEN